MFRRTVIFYLLILPVLFLLGFVSEAAFAQEAAQEVAQDDLMTLIVGGLGGLVMLGIAISRFTKTDKDDAFFARLGGIFKSLKK